MRYIRDTINALAAAVVIMGISLAGAVVFAPLAFAFNGTWIALAIAVVGAIATALPCIGIISHFTKH